MRDIHFPGRSTVHAANGMAATSHPQATLAAIDILRAGGNAVDAAIAAHAVLCVVEPFSTGIGGDCFALLVKGGQGEVIGINGSGRAPAAARYEWYAERGISQLAPDSVHTVTVPGAVDAWAKLLADHGTMGFDRVLRPAIRLAAKGYVLAPIVADRWTAATERLSHDRSARRIFLPGGAAPGEGAIHRQQALARTFRAVAKQGRDGFYRGAVAADMVAHLRAHGGLHTEDDFATQVADYVTPITTRYRDHDVYQIPPNGQGITVLVMLNILAGFDLAKHDPVSVARLHLEGEAARLAYADRNTFVADPSQAAVPVRAILSEAHARDLRAKIRMDAAMTNVPLPSLPPQQDTVYLSVVDRDRNAISFINSLFQSFGSGFCSPKSGVMFHNRGLGFVLDPTHPNCIAPRKRPMHTIIPGMLMRGGRVVMPFGVMGAHYQPTGQVHLLTNVIDYGMDVQAALDCPRAFHYAGEYDLERGIGDDVAGGLARLGHRVVRSGTTHGGGQAIRIDWRQGTLVGGSEPRKDGCALGY
ncbi:MAG: gamma-glutamyltransferase [Alphaproteobacteria bacterium]|nr:gamma-glutamyltransferase [Alphaproteobacteria bacterium]